MRLSKFNNIYSIGKHTFKNNFGLCIAYWVALFIFPLRSLMSTNLLQNRYATPMEIDYYRYMSAYTIDSLAITGLALLFTTIVGFRAFSYMHSKRKTDYYGSLPITRTAHLLGAAGSLAVMAIVPLVISTFISMLTAGFANTFGELSKLMAIQILAVLGNIAMLTLLSVVSGRLADVVVSFIMLNVGVPIIALILNFFAGELPGNKGMVLAHPDLGEMQMNLPLITALSPIFAPYTVNKLPFAEHFYSKPLSSAPNTLFYIIWWAVLSVAMIALAVILVKKRKAESAQSGFAYMQAREMIKAISAVAGGMLGGLFVIGVVGYDFSDNGFSLWYMFGCLLFSFLTEIILQLIYSKGFKEMSRFFINWGVSALIAIGSFVFIMSGMFGYVSKLPKTDTIESVDVYYTSDYTAQSDYYYREDYAYGRYEKLTLTDKDRIGKAVELHKSFIDHANEHSAFVYSSINITEGDYDRYSYDMCFVYKLKDGSTLTRYYEGYFGYDFSDNVNWRYLVNMDTIDKLKNTDALDNSGIFIYASGDEERHRQFAFMGEKYYERKADTFAEKPKKSVVADGAINGLAEALAEDISEKGILDYEKLENPMEAHLYIDGDYLLLYLDDSYTHTMDYLNSLDNLMERYMYMRGVDMVEDDQGFVSEDDDEADWEVTE